MKPCIWGISTLCGCISCGGPGRRRLPIAGTYGDARVGSADRPATGQSDGIPDTDGNLRSSYSHAHCGAHRNLAPHVHAHASTDGHTHARTNTNARTDGHADTGAHSNPNTCAKLDCNYQRIRWLRGDESAEGFIG